MYIDTHSHLNFKAFNKDVKELLQRATKAGVGKVIIPGAKISSSIKAIQLTKLYPSCYAAIGIHPHHVDEFIRLGENIVIDQLTKNIKNPKVVAIGEVGLDYYQYQASSQISSQKKEHQKKLLLIQLDLAVKFNLPVIIHCREAYDDLLILLKIYLKANPNLKGVFHCFSGDRKNLTQVLDLGFFIGFDGNITYPENEQLQKIVKISPLQKILLETDAPFLTPIPFRGNRNEPNLLPLVCNKIAKIQKLSKKTVQEVTTQNALRLFSLLGSKC